MTPDTPITAPLAAFTFATPPRLVVGWGAATDGRLAAEARRLGAHPLLVLGKSLRANGTLDRILASLRAVGVTPTLHEGVPPEPDLEAVKRCREAARLCDSVLAIGGGSVLDVAKAAAALATAEGSVRDYFDGWRTVPERGGLPILAAPTTAGTGSEATWVGVFIDRESHRKSSIRGGAMMPAVAVLDAELTVSCPPTVTADSGMDAFVQAVESYTSTGANPLTDALALAAARLASYAHVETAAVDPANRPVRESLLMGSLMAGMALNTSRLGLVHGLAPSIGVRSGAPHGAICGLLLPHVMRFNRTVAEPRYAHIAAQLLGDRVTGLSPADATDALIADLTACLIRLGRPRRLAELGITPTDADPIAREALASGSTKANPRPVTAEEVRDFTLGLI
jgi:alcohol dehydrogenase class IV